MRHATAVYCLLACLLGMRTALAADCPGHPDALGVSRTIAIDPTEHRHLGSHQYRETLPLRDHEIVLTFDDGPLPPHTGQVLDILASECARATFFMVGRMASAFPHLARRALDNGHTIANHSQNHPLRFHKFTVEQAAKEIEDGYVSIRGALGESAPVSDFFRIPGLLRQTSVEQYLDSRGLMTWSVDFMADDWHHRIAPQEIVRRALARIEARGRGILLLHDIQPATVQALPVLLRELKWRGYKIVHVVQAGPDQPKTAADPELWAARPEPNGLWPRIDIATAALPAPLLSVPSLQSFAVGFRPGAMVPATLAPGPGMLRTDHGDIPAIELWASSAVFTELPGLTPWTAPAAENFRYAQVFRSRSTPRVMGAPAVRREPAVARMASHPIGRPATAKPQPPLRSRPAGHLLQLPKPTAGLGPALPTALR